MKRFLLLFLLVLSGCSTVPSVLPKESDRTLFLNDKVYHCHQIEFSPKEKYDTCLQEAE
jgi:starvation-inducible outer membrane lipoprotein